MSQHAPMPPGATLAQLIVHGVFDRFPELRFYFAELSVCYLPAMLWYLDRDYHEFNEWFQLPLKKEPSEYVLEHVLFGMVGDALVTQMGNVFPLEKLVWGNDFPHSVGTYPNSQQYLKETFGHLDGEPAQDPRREHRGPPWHRSRRRDHRDAGPLAHGSSEYTG